MMKNEAATIRKALKSELGLNARQVSVRASRGSAIRVEVKVPMELDKVKEIAKRVAKIDYCEASGEILSGGNTFVFVGYSHELTRQFQRAGAGVALPDGKGIRKAVVAGYTVFRLDSQSCLSSYVFVKGDESVYVQGDYEARDYCGKLLALAATEKKAA